MDLPRSPCCKRPLETRIRKPAAAAGFAPRAIIFVGICGACGRDVLRRHPDTGAYEWLDGQPWDAPWDARLRGVVPPSPLPLKTKKKTRMRGLGKQPPDFFTTYVDTPRGMPALDEVMRATRAFLDVFGPVLERMLRELEAMEAQRRASPGGPRTVGAPPTAALRRSWRDVLDYRESPPQVESLRAAFRKAALRTHPDQGGSADAFIEVNEAYKIALREVGP